MANSNLFEDLNEDQRREIARAIQVAERLAVENAHVQQLVDEAVTQGQSEALQAIDRETSAYAAIDKDQLMLTLASKYTLVSSYAEYGGVASRDPEASSALRRYIELVEDATGGQPLAMEALREARSALQPELTLLHQNAASSPALGDMLREAYAQEGLERRRRNGDKRDPVMNLVELEAIAAKLHEVLAGRSAPLSASERHAYAQFAISSQRSGDNQALSKHNFLARDIASTLANIDAADSENPFLGTGLERTYSHAQRLRAYIQDRISPAPTLQDLLNERAVLIASVESAATDMHKAQNDELELFATQAKVGNATVDHQDAVLRVNGAVRTFSDALRVLREFRHRPTVDANLVKVFQEVEALELVVNKTEQGIRDLQRAGVEPAADDWADLRNVQLSLKAFLQANNATLPVRSASIPTSQRQESTDESKPVIRSQAPRQ